MMKIGKGKALNVKFYVIVAILTTLFITIENGIFLALLAGLLISMWICYLFTRL